jgi:hypothetical protein
MRFFKKKHAEAVYSPPQQYKRDKYIELINMYISTLREEDMLKVLVILEETDAQRRSEEVKRTGDILSTHFFNLDSLSK